MPAIVYALKASRPDLLHREPELALGFALREPQLLEIDVGRVEHDAGAPRPGPLLLPKVGEHLWLDRLAARHLELRVEVAAELGLGQAGVPEVRRDLPPDDVARVEDGHRASLLAVEVDPVQVCGCAREARLGRLGPLLRRGGGAWHGQPGELALLEPRPGLSVGVAAGAPVAAGLCEEPVEGIMAAADDVAELALFEDAPFEGPVDQGPDGSAVLVHRHAPKVDVV
jgi:hypothetical protein